MRVVIDSNVFISALDPRDQFYPECQPIFNLLLEEDLQALCPLLVLIETTCVIRRRTGRPKFAREVYRNLLRLTSITWLPLSLEIADRACELGIQTGLKGGDAIVLQVADDYRLPLMTKDREIHDQAPGVLTIMEPRQLLPAWRKR